MSALHASGNTGWVETLEAEMGRALKEHEAVVRGLADLLDCVRSGREIHPGKRFSAGSVGNAPSTGRGPAHGSVSRRAAAGA